MVNDSNQPKVKPCNLLEMNRKTYLAIQIIVFGFLVLAFIAVLYYEIPQKFSDNFILRNILYIIAIVAILEVLETYFTLEKR